MAGKGVSTTHPLYDQFAPKWKRARDCAGGEDAIHLSGSLYLPRLKKEDNEDYAARIKRSDFFNGTARTIDGLGGMAFRKEPTVEVPAGIEAYLEDVTMAGVSMNTFAMHALDEILKVGRMGVLVDFAAMPENVTALTVAAAQKLGLRPTLQLYTAENIINWQFGRVANQWTLIKAVLHECAVVPGDDEFTTNEEDRWRVLDLDGEGFYRQRLFRKVKEMDEQIGGDIYPLMQGKKLDRIPFVILGPNGRGDELDEPPLLDLINANIALYQINADYRHGLHFTGLPTPIVSGYVPEKDGEEFYIGSTSAWVFPDPNAKATYLEFSGKGLDSLKAAIDDKKQEMAMLGARMIADETSKARETLGATQIKRQGENGMLSRIALALSEGLEQALEIFAAWAGQAADVVFQINRDFQPTLVDAPTLTALTASLQAGAISQQEFFDLLQRGDMIDASMSFEEHQEQVASNPPPAPAPVKPGSTNENEGMAA
jgi:hypothetical protein